MMRSLFIFGVLVASLCASAGQADDYARVKTLLDTTTTNLGQPLVYPDTGAPQIKSLIVTLQPGEETGWHRHPVLTYGHILAGEVEIDYGAAGLKTYRAGDTFIEAFDTLHNGRNSGGGPLSVLVVFMGATELPDVVRPEE